MKRLVVGLVALMIFGVSQARMIQTTDQVIGHPTTIASLAKTAIKKEQVLVKSPRIPKPKFFRSNPHRIVYFSLADDSEDIFIQDEDIYTGYRRRDLGKIQSNPKDNSDGLSEDIRWRLFLARQLALMKYREKWTDSSKIV